MVPMPQDRLKHGLAGLTADIQPPELEIELLFTNKWMKITPLFQMKFCIMLHPKSQIMFELEGALNRITAIQTY